jgi:HlyD family secretion protein
MKKYKWIIWVVIIAVAGTVVWFWKFREKEQPVVLETERPQVGPIATSITATGTIQPVDTVSVGTQVSGTIKNVFADFNAKVKKGQLIAQLDKDLLNAQVQQINANLQQAKSNLVYQQSNYERYKQLVEESVVSKSEYETALYQYNTAKDNVTSVASQLSAAQKNLSYTNIYSPIDGTVLTRNVTAGQTVASSFNTPTLFVIAKDLTRMQVRAAIDEADIGNVQAGQRVTFTVDAFPDDVFEGTVEEIRLQPSVSSNVVTYVTLVNAPNEEGKLKPGMTASITVFTKEINHALLISAKATRFKPDSALLKKYTIEPGRDRSGQRDMAIRSEGTGQRKDTLKGKGPQKDSSVVAKRAVVWVKKDSTLTRRVIRIGLTDNTNVQVLSGLTPDDVVVAGVQQAGENAKASSGSARSPFMPPRRGGGSGSGRRS